MLTESALLNDGWTAELITDYLPEPTLYRIPLFEEDEPVKAWDKLTVEDAKKEYSKDVLRYVLAE